MAGLTCSTCWLERAGTCTPPPPHPTCRKTDRLSKRREWTCESDHVSFSTSIQGNSTGSCNCLQRSGLLSGKGCVLQQPRRAFQPSEHPMCACLPCQVTQKFQTSELKFGTSQTSRSLTFPCQSVEWRREKFWFTCRKNRACFSRLC